MYYIGIDLGTSAVKLLLMEESGKICNIEMCIRDSSRTAVYQRENLWSGDFFCHRIYYE